MTRSQSILPPNLYPLVDGDILTYRAGFAVKAHEPIINSLANVKNMINAILNQFPERPGYKLYLSGTGNFREKIAVTQPYKGNRDPNNKPRDYLDIRRYMEEHYNAIVVDGMEADDAIGIEQFKNKDKSTCIVSIDKDLDMIPGWHYNFVKCRGYYVTLEEADRSFWRQCLTGDRTDNVKGVHGFGTKTTGRYLPDTLSPHDCQQVVEQIYSRTYGEEGPTRLAEVKQLLWIRRQ